MDYVLKYQNGSFVAENMEGYPYETNILSRAKIFDDKSKSIVYLWTMIRQFPNDHFDSLVYRISIAPA